MTVMEALFPQSASNQYHGGKVPLVGYCLLLLPVTFSALVHFLKDDTGAYSIATLIRFDGIPDPDNLIMTMHSMQGGHQTLMLLVFLTVLWRYRNLIPFMLGILVLQEAFQFITSTLHPIGPEYYERTPPAKTLLYPMLFLHLGLFCLSIYNSCRASSRDTST
jgi:hypothetical protein